jgi:hypothetical protein
MTTTLLSEVTSDLPSAARLDRTFDADRLAGDLTHLHEQQWSLQRTYAADGSLSDADIDWRCLSLRSIGGDRDRTDPGGPGLEGFSGTSWLDKAPYLAEVLDSIPAQLRSSRLMALGPGASCNEHSDNKYGPLWGTARVHIPVVTTPGAKLFIDRKLHQWQPGTFWFGDFSKPHRVENTDDISRVHLVTDTLLSEELVALFPAADRARLIEQALINRPLVPLAAEELGQFRVRFALPRSFANWEEEDGEFLRPQESADATIDIVDSGLVLSLDGKPGMGLDHIGDGEFRFAGWTDERTIRVRPSNVTIMSRVGKQVRHLDITAKPVD